MKPFPQQDINARSMIYYPTCPRCTLPYDKLYLASDGEKYCKGCLEAVNADLEWAYFAENDGQRAWGANR